MRRLTLTLLFVLLPQVAWSQSLPDCASSEINVEMGKSFTTAEYKRTVKDWKEQEPKYPGFFRLWRAYRLYKRELSEAKKIRDDKGRHCFLGCRMAEDISFDLAVYVAWFKEQKDLKDCKLNTRFEYADFDATVDGAEAALAEERDYTCFDFCK